MTFGLRILPSADQDIDDLAEHIAQDSVEQAIRFYDEVKETYQVILDAPKRWAIYGFTHPRLADLRKRSVRHFPNHLIFYRIDADMVEIVRVLHGTRDLVRALAPDEPGQ
jgi:toxin ParE1/3/4